MEQEITFVKVSGVLFVGVLLNPKKLYNPRMVFANQEEGTISFGKCIGNPNQLEIGKFDFMYTNEDPEVAVFYNEEFSNKQED